MMKREDSAISIDSGMVAADEKKELVERVGLAVLGRILLIALTLGITGAVGLLVGYLYYTE